MLTQGGCLDRQHRLREQLAAQNIDAAVLTDYRDVYYFTGMLSAQFPVFMLLETAGGSWLVTHTDEGVSCVDDCITYEVEQTGHDESQHNGRHEWSRDKTNPRCGGIQTAGLASRGDATPAQANC